VYEIKTGFIISFDILESFQLPTLLILDDEDRVHVISFDVKIIKIDTAVVTDLVDVLGLRNGVCYFRRNKVSVACIGNLNDECFIEISDVNIFECKKNGDEIFIFSSGGVFLVEVIFMYKKVKDYRVIKVCDFVGNVGFVSDDYLFVGSEDRDNYILRLERLIDYEINEKKH